MSQPPVSSTPAGEPEHWVLEPESLAGRVEEPRRWAAWQRALAANAPAVIVVLALFVWMVFRSLDGTNTAGVQMPAMGLQHRVTYWWPFLMGETLGIAALIWSYLAVFVGLLFSTRRPRWLGLSSRQVNDVHRQLSLTTIALIVSHALFVAVGGMNGAMTARAVSFTQAFLPFETSWNQWPYAFGIFSMYLAVLLGPTYYIRGRLGARSWRIVHRIAVVVYVLAVAHTFYFDDFDFHGPYRLALWAAQIPLAAMLLWRLGAPIRRITRAPGRRALSARTGKLTRAVIGAAAAVTLAGLVVIVAAGRIGGSPSPFHVDRAASGGGSGQMPGMSMSDGSSVTGTPANEKTAVRRARRHGVVTPIDRTSSSTPEHRSRREVPWGEKTWLPGASSSRAHG